MAVCEYIKSGGLDPSRLQQTSPYGAGGPGIIAGSQRHSWVESGARGSVVELISGQDVDSVSSSPGVQRVNMFAHSQASLFSFIMFIFIINLIGVASIC